MKTTIDLPDAILHRAKIVAAQRKTTLRELVISGLETTLKNGLVNNEVDPAIARMRKGFKLNSKRVSREEAHERHPLL